MVQLKGLISDSLSQNQSLSSDKIIILGVWYRFSSFSLIYRNEFPGLVLIDCV